VSQKAIPTPLLVGLTLASSAALQAQDQRIQIPDTTIKLLGTSSAAGHALLTQIWFEDFTWSYIDDPDWGWTCSEDYTAYLTVRCAGMKPRTTYLVMLGGISMYLRRTRKAGEPWLGPSRLGVLGGVTS
jgi:hypothetical protein